LPTPAPAPSRYRFDDVLIDLDAREIHRAGERVEVEAKVFDLIALLLGNRERAMDKRELNAALWGDRPVTDAALSQQLRKARRALGDDGDAQRVIRTVHGRGLRWVAEVAEAGVEAALGASPASPPATPPVPQPVTSARWRWLALAAIALLVALASAWWLPQRAGSPATGATPRIAILPLEDQSAEPALGWTRRGLMGLMAGLFEQGGRVEIVAARNVQALDAATGPVDSASANILRHALGATHLVATRLRRVGPLYELDVRLLAAGAAERQEILHGSAPAPLAVEAVQRVRRWLDLDALPAATDRGIASPFLAEAYARGLDAQLHGDHAAARKYFDICLDQDPGLAWPRLGLAIAQGETGDAKASAENAAKVAAAAREQGDDELLIAALRQLGSLAFRRGDLDAAAAHIETALQDLSPSRPLTLTELLVAQASIEDERGHFEQSRAQFERALALARDTGNRRGEALVLVNLASLENGAGDAAAAATLLRDGLDAAREAGDSSLEGNTLANLGATEANQGHLLDAATLLQQALAIARRRGDTRLEALTTIQLTWALMPFDRDADIATLTRRVSSLAEQERNPYWQAELHWALGGAAARDKDWPQALRELERARGLYADAGMTRNLAPVLAALVETATDAGIGTTAHAAADAFRQIAAADPRSWNEWLPLLDAQLRKVDGDAAGALAALADRLDRAPEAYGAAAQASLFQLGRWQIAAGQGEDVLLREAWKPWLTQHPDAIALRIAALRAAGRKADADAEQARLDRLKQTPQLDLAAHPNAPSA
jgi:DNA-binding winged helix-turn-helix (wHTH) protein/Tfp pilus assembly protein PilF